MSRSTATNILRASLATAPGPGGAGSIGHYVQPCRKVVLSYCESSPASMGVRSWLKNQGPIRLAQMWPQVEWVVQEGKKGSEPSVTAHYVNSRTKTIGLHMLPSREVKSKLHLLISSTGRKLVGSGSRQGFRTTESKNYKKRVVESVPGAEPARGHWSQFGSHKRVVSPQDSEAASSPLP
ncbi:unnamed protein product [Parajaminaea phylloscopi]